MATPLQGLLGFYAVRMEFRDTAEVAVAAGALLAAVAIRRRKWVLTWPGLALIGIGLLVDLATPFVRDWSNLAKVTDSVALTLFLWGVIHVVFKLIETVARRGQQHFSTIFADVVRFVLYVLVLMFAIEWDFQVNPTNLVVTSGAIGIVLGLGLQESLGNIFSGLMLQMERPFQPGEWISSNQRIGRVRGIGWRSTTVLTRANERLEIPNAMVAKDILVNYGRGGVCDEFAVGISYDVPPNRVREVVTKVLIDLPGVLSDPTPDVLAWDYQDFSIKYRVKYWLIDYDALERVRDQAITSLWYALRRHRIEIPFPIRTIEYKEARHGTSAEEKFEREIGAELRRVEFLHGLSDEEIQILIPTVTSHQFGKGEILVHQGDLSDTLFMIRRGSVDVLSRTPEGKTVHVNTLTHPAIIGEAAMMTGEPRNATIRAVTDVEVLEMTKESFVQLFKVHPEAATQIADVVAKRMEQRLGAIAKVSGADGQGDRSNWLLSKMKVIFDF